MFKINFRIDGGIVLFIIFIFLMAVYFKALQQTENYNNKLIYSTTSDNQPITYNEFNIPHSGGIYNKPINDIVNFTETDDGGFVRLFENFDKKVIPMNARFWQFPNTPLEHKNKYIKAIIPINLKAYDIKVPKFTKENRPKWMNDEKMNYYNDIRKVEIYSLYPGYINASSSTSGPYNSIYEDPHNWKDNNDYIDAATANPGRYKKLISVKAGEHITGEILEPVRKVIIYGVL